MAEITAEQSKANSSFILLITIVATLGGFLFGYDSGVINGTVDGLQQAFNSDSVGTGFSVSSMLLGSAVGAFFAGWLADKFGRRNMLMVAAVLFIISAWGSGIAGSPAAFVFYRIIGGLAVGAASVMAPAYISEIAPAETRGRLTSIQQVAIIFGLFLSFLSNYFLAKLAGGSTEIFWGGHETWRWMFWIELIPAFLFLGLLFLIPKSPRFSMFKDDEAGAKKTLLRLFGDPKASQKVEEIRQSLVQDHKPRLSDTLATAKDKGFVFRTIVWVGIGLAAFQQLVGINVVFYYGAVLWQAVGFTESDALLINVLSGGLSIAAVLVTLMTIDRIGRKPFLVWGSTGMAITLAVVAFAFSRGTLDAEGTLQLPGNMGLVALIAANAYVVCFNMSWGPVMWVMLGEMFPNQIRGSGLAIAGLAQWLTNFAITFTFPIFLAGIGLAAAYSIYAVFALISVFFVLWLVKETKGKELEDMVG
ncbi:MFS transporter [Litorimonas cladophorae]|uniref:MFS transporter n=1 Tax=Litorimonas cladophorae TaxID=1220491 RepID=A0A918NDN5_9PROT|nr:sugar porter family MFS transporter [Litorimonas cladophorae]GGX62676.1 MFS transporter [Litorimonas cladophorae]